MRYFKWQILILFIIGHLGCAAFSPDTPKKSILTAAQTSKVPLDFLPALKGGYFPIDSNYTKRSYHIYIRVPAGFDLNSAQRYPVVYLLDGDSLFPLLSPTHLLLTYDEQIPEAILVGIAYGGFDTQTNTRHIDFSAPAEDAKPGADGAPQFLKFLEYELIPAIESQYPIDSTKRMLVGQSRGGYFVLWSALESPDLFWGRLASNPVFTPGRERFYEAARGHSQDDLKVMLVSGERDTQQRRHNAKQWATFWQKHTSPPWQLNYLPLKNGTHAASIGEAYRHAMVWFFNSTEAQQ